MLKKDDHTDYPIEADQTTLVRCCERSTMAFWILGLLNNSSYVIMIASASSINEGGQATIYLAATLPGFLLKTSAPYWFDLVPYGVRAFACSALMAGSFLLVGLGSNLPIQFIGVALCSLQCSLGEASMLALASRYGDPGDKNSAGEVQLTAWSSGTGFAGIFGYAWIIFFTEACGFTQKASTLLALLIAFTWLPTFFILLQAPQDSLDGFYPVEDDERPGSVNNDEARQSQSAFLRPSHANMPADTTEMTFCAKLMFFFSLWKFTIPLFVVYVSEYALQSGVWASMGFPVENVHARDSFYTWANWCYQFGVFISRSSGTVLNPSIGTLWFLPTAQTFLLVAFTLDSIYKYWYSESVYVACFVVGLLGGAVYVHAFKLLSKTVAPDERELAMASVIMPVDFGLACGSLLGLVLQGCIYEANGISGADFPIRSCK